MTRPAPAASRALLCALLVCSSCARDPDTADPPARPAPARAPADEPRVLRPAPGSGSESPIGEDELHRYEVPVEVAASFDLIVEQRGVDLALAVLGPSGESLVTVDRTPAGNRESATWVAEAPGTYSLEIRTWPGSGEGSYALRIEGVRATTRRDRVRAVAERRFAEAEALRVREDRQSCRQAVGLYLEALDRVRAYGDPRQEAEILQRLGWVHRKYLEEKRPALEYYTGALALFLDLGEDGRAASVLNNVGRVRFDLGEMSEATDAWERALAVERRLRDSTGEAYSLGNLALAYRYLGDVQKALGAYDRSIAVLHALGDRLGEGRALHNRGRFYRLLGEDGQALRDLEAALGLAREAEDSRLEAAVLTRIGEIHEGRGALEPAREALERALALRLETEDRRGLAATERALASLHERLGDVDEAVAFNRRALDGFRALGAVREEAGTLLALGELGLAAGRPDEALSPLRDALHGFEAVRDPFGTVSTRLALARAERDRGDPRAALALSERALDEIEAVRSRLGSHSLRASFFATRQEHYDLVVELRMDLHRLDPDAGHDREALAASERARVRSLIDLLTESGVDLTAGAAGADAGLVAEERELSHRLTALEQERLELGAGAPAARVEAVEARLDELVRAYRAVRGRLRAASPRYAAVIEPRTLTAEQIQRLLDPWTTLLEIHLGEPRSVLWVVTGGEVASFELASRAVIEDAARRAHELLAVSHLREYRSASARALAELSALVLGPAAERLAGRRLLVSAAGALQLAPFGALPAPGGDDREPLVARHEIVSVPSASALAVLRERLTGRPRPTETVAVVADPVFEATDVRLQGGVEGEESSGEVRIASSRRGGELGRLPFSSREAEAILRLAGDGGTYRALGFEATREVAMSPSLGRYRVVHFATHGELDGEHPELSRLVFSRFHPDGRPRAGELFAHEIFDLDLPVDLVVLSACETALGKEVRGEGLVGLTQGFFHAGAERVLVSLWRVDDRATAELMTRFYEGLFVTGLAPPAALRQAQLAVRGEPGWQAPYYWAGFVLQGEWR